MYNYSNRYVMCKHFGIHTYVPFALVVLMYQNLLTHPAHFDSLHIPVYFLLSTYVIKTILGKQHMCKSHKPENSKNALYSFLFDHVTVHEPWYSRFSFFKLFSLAQ